MNVIILAAGSGIRLGQHTQDTPKALVDVNGKSILDRQILSLRKHGVDKIFVVTGFKKENMFEKMLSIFLIQNILKLTNLEV
uniref:Transcriptional regulator n=1 Tax=uncultured marine thaumarchaeote KM3_13_H10 TaxID=1456008 RepID=A0A075GAB1_9ARCH|nr:Transcriptional regulator [uncultured marine thaumarchaeote KM3_13_H10]